VTLTIPGKERIDMTRVHRILVTRFIVDQEAPEFDLAKELVNVLRRDMRQKAGLDVLEIEPPSLPEQPFQELLANTGFWRRLAGQFEADLVIAGQTSFRVADRSGYEQVDEISPVTMQRVRRTRFVEREAFSLDLHLFFLAGGTGELLYEDHFNGEDTASGMGSDRMSAMFDLYDHMSDDVRAIVSPRQRQVQRNLFTE
jgi:hypothetical protein